jgi:hypothetical protein
VCSYRTPWDRLNNKLLQQRHYVTGGAISGGQIAWDGRSLSQNFKRYTQGAHNGALGVCCRAAEEKAARQTSDESDQHHAKSKNLASISYELPVPRIASQIGPPRDGNCEAHPDLSHHQNSSQDLPRISTQISDARNTCEAIK